MPVRILNTCGILALLGGLAWLLAGHTAPAVESAAALTGERWYRLELEQRHVGYLHTVTGRDPLGRWQFDSDLRFVLSEGNPVRIAEQLVFAATPPFELLRAHQRSDRAGITQGTVIERVAGEAPPQDDAYQVWRLGSSEARRPLPLTFTLSDYLASETWLREDQPPAGAIINASALDFDRRRLVTRTFRVVARNPDGYELENPAPLDPTRILLDAELRPVTMTLSGLFRLTLASRAQALAPRSALQAASYFVPTDRPLNDHTRIRALELEVTGDAAATDLWPELVTGGALHREANAVSTPRLLGDELAETADHPISDRRIRAMARTAVAGVSGTREQVDALTHFVNRYLRYSEDGVERHVLALLDDPVGDCSEFADLLTTLARSLDIPSRTVFGLAYGDGTPPAFRFHAWNEFKVDGTWYVVDPTWDQLRVDATHIPMPADPAHALELLTGGLQVAFVIRDIEYF